MNLKPPANERDFWFAFTGGRYTSEERQVMLPQSEEILALHNQVGFEQQRVERLIMRTPTGPLRNQLTEVNIHLMMAVAAIKKVNLGEVRD